MAEGGSHAGIIATSAAYVHLADGPAPGRRLLQSRCSWVSISPIRPGCEANVGPRKSPGKLSVVRTPSRRLPYLAGALALGLLLLSVGCEQVGLMPPTPTDAAPLRYFTPTPRPAQRASTSRPSSAAASVDERRMPLAASSPTRQPAPASRPAATPAVGPRNPPAPVELAAPTPTEPIASTQASKPPAPTPAPSPAHPSPTPKAVASSTSSPTPAPAPTARPSPTSTASPTAAPVPTPVPPPQPTGYPESTGPAATPAPTPDSGPYPGPR